MRTEPTGTAAPAERAHRVPPLRRAAPAAGLVLLLAAMLAAPLLVAPPATWSYGAYLGGMLRGSSPGSGSEAVDANVQRFRDWSRWAGHPPPTVYADFTSAADWDGVDGYPAMFEGYAALPPGTRINLGVPLLTSDPDTTLRRGADGDYTGRRSAFRSLARNVVDAGLGGRVVYRLGWEMNAASGFRWALNGDVDGGNPSYADGDAERGVDEFVTYWRLVVEDIRAVDRGATFHFCPINGWDGTGPTPASMYPGDEWVDYVGVDVYDVDYTVGTYDTLEDSSPARVRTLRDAAWAEILHGSHGLDFWRRFAHEHDKLLAVGEWGPAPLAGTEGATAWGGGDNPRFVERMHAFFSRSAREGVMGFDVRFDVLAHDGDFRFHPTSESPYPRSAARYAALDWGVTTWTVLGADGTAPRSVAVGGADRLVYRRGCGGGAGGSGAPAAEPPPAEPAPAEPPPAGA